MTTIATTTTTQAPPAPAKPGLGRTLLVIPTLNEEEGLGSVLRQARDLDVATLVIDGGSTDRTLDIAAAAGVEVRPVPRGKARAWREFMASRAMEAYEYVAMVDADGTYDLGALPRLMELGADMVIARRQCSPGSTPVHRRIGASALTLTASALTLRRCPDVLSGFRLMRTDCLSAIKLTSEEFGLEAELTIEFLRRGFSVDWVPTSYRPRFGRSKLRPVRDGLEILLTMLRTRLRRL